jgi:DNA repair exonuclease SbcCD ATPase subunit
MDARRSNTPDGSPGRASVRIDDLPLLREPEPRRVMSVSARDVRERQDVPAEQADRSESIFLTPRVIDQGAFDELSRALRSQLEEADRKIVELGERLEQVRQSDDQPARSAEQLQERLRLGARMLKAFQSQIDRVGASIEQLQTHRQQTEDAVATVDERLDALRRDAAVVIDETSARLEQRVADAIAAIDRQTVQRQASLPKLDEIERMFHELTHDSIEQIETHLARRRPDVDAVDQRLAMLRHRAEELAQLVERAESETGMMTQRLGDATSQLDDRARQASSIAQQCEEAKAVLSNVLLSAVDEIDDMSMRCDGLGESIDRHLERCAEAERSLNARTERITEAAQQLEPAAHLCDRLERVLARLEPWERLLLHADADESGMPRPVASMVEGLRDGLGRDMAKLSATMRDLADRVDNLGLPKQATEEQGDDIEETPPPEVEVTADREASAEESKAIYRFTDHVKKA